MNSNLQLVIAALAVLPMVCAAQEEGSGACRADLQRFCAAAAGAGGAKAANCLIDHQKEISDACYDALKARLERKQNGGAEACRTDAAQFCKDVQSGGGRMLECLIDHQKEISDGCYEFLKARQSGAAEPSATAPSKTVFRSRLPDGRILYSDAPPPPASLEREVPMDRVVNVPASR